MYSLCAKKNVDSKIDISKYKLKLIGLICHYFYALIFILLNWLIQRLICEDEASNEVNYKSQSYCVPLWWMRKTVL